MNKFIDFSDEEIEYKKSFANIISKKEFGKFNIKEKEQFYINNKIYIPSRDLEKGPKRGHTHCAPFDINPQLANEIIKLFFKTQETCNSTSLKLSKITTRINYLESNDEQFKRLHEEIKTYTRKLNTNDLVLDFQSIYEVPLKIWDEYFQEYFIDNMINEDCLIEEYITDFEKMNFEKFYIFNKLIRLFRNRDILEYLKTYKNDNFKQYEVNIPVTSPNLSLNQSLLLLDKIVKLDKWDDLENTKKARIISKLINKDYYNTRKGLGLLDAKPDKQTKQFKKDREIISNLLNDILT